MTPLHRAATGCGFFQLSTEDNPIDVVARAPALLSLTLLLMALMPAGALAAETVVTADAQRFSLWIEEMKRAERGPFARIRWFCKDGQILPPTSYACKDFGGGAQHGEWSDRTKTLREAGYYVANFYSDLDIDAFLRSGAESDRFQQMLIEQFLIRFDDGWILRRAQFYRGAFQEEGERRGARRLLLKLAERRDWLDYRYIVLRTAARYLKHGQETPSVQEIRQLSASLSNAEPAFKPLRNKIHGTPEAADAAAVRAYAAHVPDSPHSADYARLAGLIDAVYAADIAPLLRDLERSDTPAIATLAADARRSLAASDVLADEFGILARLLAGIRDTVSVPNGPRERLELVDASLVIESELFTTAARLDETVAGMTRAARLRLLEDSLYAVYGAGFVTGRQLDAARGALSDLLTATNPDVGTYKATLDYLSLVPSWGTQRLRQFFGAGMDKLAAIEPLAMMFIQDYVRGSPLFTYALRVDELVRDANALAGVRNELFGDDVGAGLRSLNPGLARGTLYAAPGRDHATLDQHGIHLLPETVSELPPVAGILTEGEGNPLSHVQLLARNLGIPNVGVDQTLVPSVRERAGARVILAVSPAGSVQLSTDDGRYDGWFNAADDAAGDAPARIVVDLQKLDLEARTLLTLSALRATDSGRTVGPKAAKLGELKHHYPAAVAEGLAIPFGVFRALIEQPMPGGEATSIFEWMRGEYRRLASLPAGSEERTRATEAFRARLHATIAAADPGAAFRRELRAKMLEVFGADGTFGVFVRSDTNVEDLPGFTGAGLNLTVPNVVGIDNIIAAISRVWASPFTARAFAWRQALMDKPEHVYPAVLLMRSVDSEKSGVLVTQDIDTGARNALSVAVNEGVGGAVDGQSAESLRIDMDTGAVRLKAAATAAVRRQVDLSGGVSTLPVSTRDHVLTAGEIAQLVTLARELPTRFPPVVDDVGRPAPADIEFGFVDGQLRLFQIRPFLDNAATSGNALLRQLDAALADHADRPVDLDATP